MARRAAGLRLIRDRLIWMRFFGFDPGGTMPDENTIRHYRNRLSGSGTLAALMQAFDRHLAEQGYLAMGGQIVDATQCSCPQAAQHRGGEGGGQGRTVSKADLAR